MALTIMNGDRILCICSKPSKFPAFIGEKEE
jgi:hypothetical protein